MRKPFHTTKGVVFSGPCPNIDDLELLRSLGVDAIWNLAKELAYICDLEKEYIPIVICSNIEDFSIPDCKESFLNELDQVISLLNDEKKVFVHCMGGRGRTGMALACIARRLDNFSAKEACKLAKEYCNGPETNGQIRFVYSL